MMYAIASSRHQAEIGMRVLGMPAKEWRYIEDAAGLRGITGGVVIAWTDTAEGIEGDNAIRFHTLTAAVDALLLRAPNVQRITVSLGTLLRGVR